MWTTLCVLLKLIKIAIFSSSVSHMVHNIMKSSIANENWQFSASKSEYNQALVPELNLFLKVIRRPKLFSP
jgi:hypothetical protein